MNVELLNAIIAAGTSIIVVILSQILISSKDKKQARALETNNLLKEFLNPIRFMLAENYFRINKIVEETQQKGKHDKILVINNAEEVIHKDTEWFVGEGCYLMSSCYFVACLFAYIEKIRRDIPFLKLPNHIDTELIRRINKLVAGFSKNLNIYYAIQMNIGKEFYIKEEQRLITYREFCEVVKDKANLCWYKPLITYFLRIASGEYHETQYILKDIKEFTKYLDEIVSGGDSIEQKILAEKEVAERL